MTTKPDGGTGLKIAKLAGAAHRMPEFRSALQKKQSEAQSRGQQIE